MRLIKERLLSKAKPFTVNRDNANVASTHKLHPLIKLKTFGNKVITIIVNTSCLSLGLHLTV